MDSQCVRESISQPEPFGKSDRCMRLYISKWSRNKKRRVLERWCMAFATRAWPAVAPPDLPPSNCVLFAVRTIQRHARDPPPLLHVSQYGHHMSLYAETLSTTSYCQSTTLQFCVCVVIRRRTSRQPLSASDIFVHTLPPPELSWPSRGES